MGRWTRAVICGVGMRLRPTSRPPWLALPPTLRDWSKAGEVRRATSGTVGANRSCRYDGWRRIPGLPAGSGLRADAPPAFAETGDRMYHDAWREFIVTSMECCLPARNFLHHLIGTTSLGAARDERRICNECCRGSSWRHAAENCQSLAASYVHRGSRNDPRGPDPHTCRTWVTDFVRGSPKPSWRSSLELC